VAEVRPWLLGLLPEQESRSLEERLITDSGLYEEVFIVEEELIDDYIAGRLSADERKAFESYFMNSAERQEQYRIANALRVYIADAKKSKTEERRRWPFGAIALAAAAVVIVALVGVVPMFQSGTGKSYTVALTPGGPTRDSGPAPQRITIPPDTDTLELELKLTRNDFQKYRATLLNSDGGTIQINDNLTGPTLRFSVKTQQTPPGEYRLKVDGINPDGTSESADSYRFVVSKN
jgi:hypothetical protein